jgi:hypothetical protein
VSGAGQRARGGLLGQPDRLVPTCNSSDALPAHSALSARISRTKAARERATLIRVTTNNREGERIDGAVAGCSPSGSRERLIWAPGHADAPALPLAPFEVIGGVGVTQRQHPVQPCD